MNGLTFASRAFAKNARVVSSSTVKVPRTTRSPVAAVLQASSSDSVLVKEGAPLGELRSRTPLLEEVQPLAEHAQRHLVVRDPAPEPALPRQDVTTLDRPSRFEYAWKGWLYNSFGFEVSVPRSGWLLIRQLYDPLWHVTVDAQPATTVPANVIGMALPVSAGHHYVHLDYQPLGRRLYWPAALVTPGNAGRRNGLPHYTPDRRTETRAGPSRYRGLQSPAHRPDAGDGRHAQNT